LRRHQERVESLPLGVNLEQFAAPTPQAVAYGERLKAAHREPIWLAVGRCVYYKSFDVAIRALALVPGTLVLVGHGPLEPSLRQLAKDLGVADRVVWRHYLTPDELVGAYRAATALWFPSSARSEAFGLVQVEAMACGTPVINTHITGSGVPWVCPDERTGLTVPINDPVALAAAARRLIDEPSLYERLSAAARERAHREFDHRIMARRSFAVYERVSAREERKASNWSFARPILRAVWPPPEYRRPNLDDEALGEESHSGLAM
jgi:rhamnosyl/mannosyltransferase